MIVPMKKKSVPKVRTLKKCNIFQHLNLEYTPPMKKVADRSLVNSCFSEAKASKRNLKMDTINLKLQLVEGIEKQLVSIGRRSNHTSFANQEN